MSKFLSWFIALFIIMCLLTTSDGRKKNNSLNDNNICSRIEKYEEKHVVPTSEKVKEFYTTWCLSIPPRCKTYRWKTVKVNKTITVINTRTVFECCKGYEKVNGSCIPICLFRCQHGECVAPDTCSCKAGWKEPYCLTECEPDRYGQGCMNKCSCMHNATCDSKNGSCRCNEGYTGTYCEYPCRNGTYGLNCRKKCECQHGALCDVIDGSCDCLPGYIGYQCEKPCDIGMHGENCQKECVCINESTKSCSHIDGKCICKPGYKGLYCEEKCPNLTYGVHCDSQCDCDNSDFCDPVSGECICKPGWIGTKCSERCANGTFGEQCMFKCIPCHNGAGSCNHVTGRCDCPQGTAGVNCEMLCSDGYWGVDCSEMCFCMHDGICNGETGECLCYPGWIGLRCTETCPTGSYGFNCSKECTCDSKAICDPVDGQCWCDPGWTGNNCDILDESPEFEKKIIYGVVITVIACLAVFFVFLYIYSTKTKVPCGCCFQSLERTDGARSTDTIVHSNFSNPSYEIPDTTNVNSEDSNARQNSVPLETGLHKLKNLIDNLSDETTDSRNTSEIGKRQSSQLALFFKRSSTTSDLSSSGIRHSGRSVIYASVQEPNMDYSPSTVDNGEDYEPEQLCIFKILEDNIYENIPFNQTSNAENSEKCQKRENE